MIKKRILTACDKASWRWWWYLRPSHLKWLMSGRVGIGDASIKQTVMDEKVRNVVVGRFLRFVPTKILCFCGIHYYYDEKMGIHSLFDGCFRCGKVTKLEKMFFRRYPELQYKIHPDIDKLLRVN